MDMDTLSTKQDHIEDEHTDTQTKRINGSSDDNEEASNVKDMQFDLQTSGEKNVDMPGQTPKQLNGVENGIDDKELKDASENMSGDIEEETKATKTIKELNSELKGDGDVLQHTEKDKNVTENVGDQNDYNTDITNHVKEDQGKEDTEKKEEDGEKESWTHVLGHDKLKLKVLRKGEADTRPLHGQVVTVRCCGELEDGTKIDETDELRFTVGDGDVIQAIDLCIAMMQLQELSQIVTDAKYAYGHLGRKPDVPANAAVTYEVELLKVEDAPDVTKLSIKEKIKLGDEKRERGNFWYSRAEYSAAINSYTKALRLLDESNIASEQESYEDFTEMRVKCFNNLAASQLKVEAWDAGIRSCDSVLKLQPNNCKAHFRKGKCFAAKGEMEKAISSMREAIKYEPESKLIHQELSRLVKKNKAQKQSRQEMYQRMFGTEVTTPKKTTKKSSWWLGGSAMVVSAVLALGVAVGYRYWQ